ncbi:structural maintenance of chromosome protein [Tieghemostelium lacteum]|uniref:Structural maintenance of chromosomes protein 5 n=1 Tax=Tieghemostelium lacteum TaxID=361077 RepID=A0A152AA56_TIELA|nr:structural maintenance of chromosome protein [Tieghemostelium lacteum]|eukprot:KYR03011.1 structural maintenance of chromosome protein [Tieghemostelium lacteum]
MGDKKRKFQDFENQHTQNITEPTPSSQLNGESTGDYIPGSIVRMKLINFVTYSEVEFRPGPRLNVIIGPNGSGKSSIVCAIALGLGGGTNLLGRAKQVSDFIKHGCDKAIIEIELYNKDKNMVIRRDIYKDNTGDFKLNGKNISKTDLLHKVKELSVQVDNLCQFLPQDKVVCFAAMTPTELLQETEKAIAVNDMYENHMKLIDLKKEQVLYKNSFSEQNTILDDLKKQNQSLEKDVKKYKEREEYLAMIKNLQSKKLWVLFEECREKVVAAKESKTNLEKELATLEREKSHPMQAIRELEKVVRESKEKVQQLTTKISSAESQIQKKSQLKEKIVMEIERHNTELDGLNSRADQRANEIKTLGRTKADCERELSTLPNEDSLKAKVNEMNACLKDINQQAAEFQNEKYTYQQQKDQLEKELNMYKRELDNINNKAHQTLELVRKNSPEVFEAYNFVKQNGNMFQHQVFGPICMEINVENEEHAKYLENSIPPWLLMGFAFQCREDKDTFLRELVDRKRLNLNTIFLPNRVELRRQFDVKQLDKKYDITYTLDQVFESSPTVFDAIMDTTPLYNMAAGTKETLRYEEEIIEKTDVPILFTPNRNFSKTRSLYGNRETLTKVTNVRPPKFLTGINKQKRNELQDKIKDIQGKIQQIVEKIRQIDQKESAVKNRSKEFYDQRNQATGQLEERKKLYNKIANSQRQIDNLSREEDNTTISRNIKEKIMQCIEKMAENTNSATKDLLDMCKIFVERDQQHIKQSREECRLNFETAKFEESQRKINEMQDRIKKITMHFNELAKEAKQRKAEAEKVAPVQEDEELKKLLFETIKEESVEEIELSIDHYQNKANFITSNNPRVVQEYENRCQEIEKLEDRLNNHNRSLETMATQMENLKKSWMKPVEKFIKSINEKFTKYFEYIGCQGEVKLGFDPQEPDDFSKYSIDIYVKFRETENLKKLDAHVQSGGERSVSTMLFLISLQELTVCPFRVVDEINQGMDPKNERMIFDQIVQTANKPGLPQYFLITPKLLQDLSYSVNTTVLCVYTGPWSMTQKELEYSLDSAINIKTKKVK